MARRRTPTIRSIIVDDEEPARVRLLECLKRQSHVEVVAMATNGREALELLSKHAIDLLFLDVQMPELDGFDVLRQMEGSRPPVTIFVTAYDQYAIKAFEQHAF